LTKPKIFDDRWSIIHTIAGVLAGALGGLPGFFIGALFVLYQMGESKSTEEFLGDWFEFWWGWWVWAILHMHA